MTKKASIFKTIKQYFGGHLAAGLGWIWVAVMPGLGSLYLLSNTQILESSRLDLPSDHLIFTLVLAVLLGFALLPTTLASLASGFYFGWLGFPGLFVGYFLANIIGYSLGKYLNTNFLPLLYHRKPALQPQLEIRLQHPQSLIFYVRISPVIPFAISNFLFASLKIDLKKVLLYGIPGMLPRTFLAFGTGLMASSLLDAKKALNDPKQWAILLFLFGFSVWGLYRNWKKSKT